LGYILASRCLDSNIDSTFLFFSLSLLSIFLSASAFKQFCNLFRSRQRLGNFFSEIIYFRSYLPVYYMEKKKSSFSSFCLFMFRRKSSLIAFDRDENERTEDSVFR